MLHHTEMQKTLKDLLDQQSKAERIKNFPYPRQYATINTHLRLVLRRACCRSAWCASSIA